jgi:uncharacterized protein YecT (DUF1311 family)
LILFLSVSSPVGASEITQEDFKNWVAARYEGGCTGPRNINIEKGNFILNDLDGDGVSEALVTAHTCITGTGGPETFVLKLGPDGKLQEIPMGSSSKNLLPLPQVGNRFSLLRLDEGKKIYADYGGGIKIFYELKKSELIPVRAEHPPLGNPSFKCSGDKLTELEIAICWDQESSNLDRELMQLYVDLGKNLSESEKKKLDKEQTTWIKKRNKECSVYKWHYECLKKLYTKQITALTRRIRPNIKK